MQLVFLKRAGVYVVRWTDAAGKRHERSTGTNIRRDAERFLVKLETELGPGLAPRKAGALWNDLIEAIEETHFPTIADKTRAAYSTALNAFEKHCKPRRLDAINTAMISRFRNAILEQCPSKVTAATYVRHVRSALSFAKDQGLLEELPHWPRAKRGQNGTKMRGFVLTGAEVRAWIRSELDPRIRDALWLMVLSGLRLGEAISLSWDADAPNRVELDAKPYPVIHIGKQKNGEISRLPLSTLLRLWLERHRKPSGPVLSLWKDTRNVRRMFFQSGLASPVRRLGKHPTPHDLRRTYGTYWARFLLPQELQMLLRHSSFSTTLKFYIAAKTDGLAEKLNRRNTT